MRNWPLPLTVRLPEPLNELVKGCDGTRSVGELLDAHPGAGEPGPVTLERLLEEEILVEPSRRRRPSTRAEKRICTRCTNDDYLLPGLDFDAEGVCGFCQTYDSLDASKLSLPFYGDAMTPEEILAYARKDNRSRFEIAVGFTGGKDSSFLLWFLVKKLGLRVLAITWDFPFMSETALANQRAVRMALPTVEFISHWAPLEVFRACTVRSLTDNAVPCLCSTVGPLLIYTHALREQVPLMINGSEDAQVMIGAREMDLSRISSDPRERTLISLRGLRAALRPHEAKLGAMTRTVYEAIESPEGRVLPRLCRMYTSELYGSWSNVAETLEKELGWRRPPQAGLLHTSCKVERYKDHGQWIASATRPTLPIHAYQIGAAVHAGMLTREEGFAELEERRFEAADEEVELMRSILTLTEEEVAERKGFLPAIFGTKPPTPSR
jgi:hypothetical protein